MRWLSICSRLSYVDSLLQEDDPVRDVLPITVRDGMLHSLIHQHSQICFQWGVISLLRQDSAPGSAVPSWRKSSKYELVVAKPGMPIVSRQWIFRKKCVKAVTRQFQQLKNSHRHRKLSTGPERCFTMLLTASLIHFLASSSSSDLILLIWPNP